MFTLHTVSNTRRYVTSCFAAQHQFHSKCTDQAMSQDDVEKNQALLDYFSVTARIAMHSVNVPLGILSVFRQWNLGITTRTHPFNGPLSGTTRVSRYQKGKTNLDFIEARDSEWQWQSWVICKSALCSRQIATPAPHHSSFLQAFPSCGPTNSVKALKAQFRHY